MDVAVNLAQVAAALIAASTLFWGVCIYTKSSRLEHYTELDRLYFDIVALRMAHPHLGDPDLIRRLNLEQRTERALRYDSYALLIWNFIETIFDRCKQRDLLETWKPILDHEGELHCETGLHVGAGKGSLEIGSSDNPVIKDAFGRPYIPGSSLRGTWSR